MNDDREIGIWHDGWSKQMRKTKENWLLISSTDKENQTAIYENWINTALIPRMLISCWWNGASDWFKLMDSDKTQMRWIDFLKCLVCVSGFVDVILKLTQVQSKTYTFAIMALQDGYSINSTADDQDSDDTAPLLEKEVEKITGWSAVWSSCSLHEMWWFVLCFKYRSHICYYSKVWGW